MVSVYFAVRGALATNSRALIKKKINVGDMRLNTLRELIDALDQASSEITGLLFFGGRGGRFSSTLCSLPCKISYIQSLAADVGDFWLRPLE